MTDLNILIVGVGGQGTLLASRVLGAMASLLSLDCKLSEVHGMSQRGGSVVTHVRIGKSVSSPIITAGGADYILAFEKLEALRWHHYLKKAGKILINLQEILPMPVITGQAEYPKAILETIKEKGLDIKVVDGLDLSHKAGSTKAVNVVMLGALAKIMGIKLEIMQEAVKMSVKERFIQMNLAALELGYNA